MATGNRGLKQNNIQGQGQVANNNNPAMLPPGTNPDLLRAFNALRDKQVIHNKFFSYYHGTAPLPYFSERLRNVFKGIVVHIVENWASVVVDATWDRITLNGFQVTNDQVAHDLLAQLWSETELALESDDAMKAALITGESYIIAWRDPSVVGEDVDQAQSDIELYYNDPRLCHVFYESDNPRKKLFGCKWFDGADGFSRLTLYYPDRLEYYIATRPTKDITVVSAYQPDNPPEVANPYGELPIFHLRPDRTGIKSDLQDVVPLQDAINMLLTNMIVCGEYAAFPQKYIISNAEAVGKLKNSPDLVWELPGASVGEGSQPTSVGQFEPAKLDNYLQAIDNIVSCMGVITRTPKHYFYRQGGDPSGEALMTMEAPLIKKCQDRIARFEVVWRQVAAFLLKLSGHSLAANFHASDINPIFDSPHSMQPLTRALVYQAEVTAGIPLTLALKRDGWSQAEVEELATHQLNQGHQDWLLAQADHIPPVGQ